MSNLKKINVNNNVYDLGYTEIATEDAKGLMSAADKAKLNAMKDASVTEQAISDAADLAAKAEGDAAAAKAVADANTTLLGTVKSTAEAASTAADNAQDAADAADAKAQAAQDDVDAVEGRMDTAESNISAHGTKLTELENAMKNLPTDTAISNLQSQIDAVNAGQNLADIVATAAALASMDKTNLQANDKVEVLADENHNGAATVYNWTGSAFEYIGVYGQDAYTKSEIDTKLSEVEAHANKVEFSVADETLTISVVGHTA